MAVMTAQEFQSKYKRPPSNAPMVSTGPDMATPPRSFGDTVGNVAQGVTDFVGAHGIADQFGATIAQAFAPISQKSAIQFPSQQEVLGSAVQSGANLIPGVGKGVGLLGKMGVGAATGYAMDVGSKLQIGQEEPLKPGVATVAGAAIPGAGAIARPGVAILGRLLKGIGSGLSGVPVHQIEQIFTNPQAAQSASKQIAQAGKSKVLEENARTVIEGVGKIRKEARTAYGEALGGLKAEDINPTTFRRAIQPVLDKVGSILDPKTNTRTLNNVEFSEQKNLDKAGQLIDEVTNTPLDGLSLRNLTKKIEDTKYKTATSDERLSFNAFLKDLSGGLKDAVHSSTDKLSEMNSKFAGDMELADAVQGIFGKVKFKNLGEVNKASQKLEALFQQKGLSPDITNSFLKRIGVNPEEFKTSEAVRQLEGKEGGANSVGLNPGEVVRGITSSVVTPEMVGQISAATGAAREAVEPFLKSLPTPARNAVLQALLQAQISNQQQ